MAFGAIDIVSLTRTQDYTAIKQNEDAKGQIAQTNISQQVQKDADQRTREVRSSDDADWYNRKSDAKEKGDNEYSGDGGRRRRRKEPSEQVVVKGRGGFDMKI